MGLVETARDDYQQRLSAAASKQDTITTNNDVIATSLHKHSLNVSANEFVPIVRSFQFSFNINAADFIPSNPITNNTDSTAATEINK